MLFGAKKSPEPAELGEASARPPNEGGTVTERSVRARLDELDDEVTYLKHRFLQLQTRVMTELRRFAREWEEEGDYVDEQGE